MQPTLLKALQEGWKRLREHPQLGLTILVALAIAASFIFVAVTFLRVASDAQDQLTRVRIGSLQDAFAPLGAELWQEPDTLRSYMRELQSLNPTIISFDIVEKSPDGKWLVTRSAESSREGSQIFRQDLLLSLAQSEPNRSFTTSQSENGTRYFYTARAIRERGGGILGEVLTRQTLSAADEAISQNMRQATLILVVVLLFLLLLFFRHARIIDYIALYKKLQEVDELKDEFISMASHELRAPLTAIRGYVEMLQEKNLTPEQSDQSLSRVASSAKQLDSLIADMLDVSRIEQGRMKLEPSKFETKSAIDEQCDIWQSRAKEKNLELHRELSEGLSITADPDRFRQVVINLLSNAVKYTNHGAITVKTSREGGRFILRVSDTGIGMTEEERGGLFKKFYRAPGEDVRKETGTGLGLWITKQMIELMGGTISVESIKGVGSHFIVSFPLAL